MMRVDHSRIPLPKFEVPWQSGLLHTRPQTPSVFTIRLWSCTLKFLLAKMVQTILIYLYLCNWYVSPPRVCTSVTFIYTRTHTRLYTWLCMPLHAYVCLCMPMSAYVCIIVSIVWWYAVNAVSRSTGSNASTTIKRDKLLASFPLLMVVVHSRNTCMRACS